LDEGEVLERSGNAGNGTLYGSGTRVEVSF
jgi:hypothetical protein